MEQGSSRDRVLLGSAAALTVVLSVLLERHAAHLNGPDYWAWHWRSAPLWPRVGVFAAASAPIALAMIGRARGRLSLPLALLSAASGAFCLMLASLWYRGDPAGFQTLIDLVFHPTGNGYFIDAHRLADSPGWLVDFHERMADLGPHSQNKPPGALLYWGAWISALGPTGAAALDGALVLGLAACLAVPATAWLTHEAGGDPDQALTAGCLLALCPGFLFFLPNFDPVLAALSAALLAAWIGALRRDCARLAVVAGGLLGGALLLSYSFLVLGFALLGALIIATHPAGLRGRPIPARRAAVLVGAAALAALLVQAILPVATGYHPAETFLAGLENQSVLEAARERLWRRTILFDQTDFALGLGWLPVLAAAAWCVGVRRRGGQGAHTAIVALLLLQPIVVGLTGVLRAETARVWIFMMPCVCVAAGLVVGRRPLGERLLWLALAGVVVLQLDRNLLMLFPW